MNLRCISGQVRERANLNARNQPADLNTQPSRPIRDGIAFRDGKLYVFCRRSGILVVSGWPCLRAWRKTPKGKQWIACRPEVSLKPIHLGVASRRSQPAG